jgi:hypothetical protein
MAPIAGIRKNEAAVEPVSGERPSSTEESKDSEKEVSINYLRKMIGKEIISFDAHSIIEKTVSNFWGGRGTTCILVTFIEASIQLYDMINLLLSPSYDP